MTAKIATALALAGLVLTPATAFAASKEEKKTIKLAVECTYVVQMAEGNGVRLTHSSAQWQQITAGLSQQFGVDPTPYIAEARAKYKKRERVMGSSDAMRAMIDRAHDCNKQLG